MQPLEEVLLLLGTLLLEALHLLQHMLVSHTQRNLLVQILQLLLQVEELIEFLDDFDVIDFILVSFNLVKHALDVASGLLRRHVLRDALQQQAVLIQLTVALVVLLVLAAEVEPGSSASPEAVDADVHHDRRDYGEEVGDEQLCILVDHVQNSEFKEVDFVELASLERD